MDEVGRLWNYVRMIESTIIQTKRCKGIHTEHQESGPQIETMISISPRFLLLENISRIHLAEEFSWFSSAKGMFFFLGWGGWCVH